MIFPGGYKPRDEETCELIGKADPPNENAMSSATPEVVDV
jgi:hypothetical protein